MGIAERVDRKITAYGEDYLLNGVTPEKGFFSLLDNTRMRIMLDDTEAATVIKPGLYLVTRATSVIAVDDTVLRDGKEYVVLKTAIERFGGLAVVKVAVLSQSSW